MKNAILSAQHYLLWKTRRFTSKYQIPVVFINWFIKALLPMFFKQIKIVLRGLPIFKKALPILIFGQTDMLPIARTRAYYSFLRK